MSELVWFSYKVIKVAIRLQSLGEEIDFFIFLRSHQKKPFYRSKIESTELHQRQYLERGLRLFFGFHNASHFFHPKKAGPRYKLKSALSDISPRFELYIAFRVVLFRL